MAMKPRRSPARGPLLTFALMIGSVAAVGAIAHYIDTHQKAPTQQTVSASASDSSEPTNR
jgi:hypothetical protein